MYENNVLVEDFAAPSGGTCGTRACWRDLTTGYAYSDKEGTPEGVIAMKLSAGTVPGKAKITVKGKGSHLGLPDLSDFDPPLTVQLHKSSGGACWGAAFPTFQKNDGVTLKAVSGVPGSTTTTTIATTTTSTTSTTLAPLWSAIHANVIYPVCSGCHGSSGGLGGFANCGTAHAALVNVVSTELATMDRVEPGDPTNSWIMHKLDNTQGTFTGQCTTTCGSSMPFGSGLLPLSTRDAIRTWITNGAVNDCP